MADEVDAAGALAAAERDSMIDRARAAASRPGPPYNGSCYACGEDVPEPKIFCDAACSSAHARRKRRY